MFNIFKWQSFHFLLLVTLDSSWLYWSCFLIYNRRIERYTGIMKKMHSKGIYIMQEELKSDIRHKIYKGRFDETAALLAFLVAPPSWKSPTTWERWYDNLITYDNIASRWYGIQYWFRGCKSLKTLSNPKKKVPSNYFGRAFHQLP